jgi:protein-S-isoprenylcysteine O-methyltransferase Ste14
MSRILAIQILYLAAFAAAHSLMTSRPFKGLMWRILGPRTDRLYMKFFSIFAAITFAPLILLILIFPGKKLYLVPSPWRWIMVAGQLLAGIGTLLAFTNAPHRFIISQQLRKAEKLDTLQPRGIYRYVRDPFLLTGLVQMWLMPFMTIRLLVLFILSSIYLCLGSLHWEMRLEAQFGKEYVEYRKKVPRIIPGVLNRT